MCILLLSIGKFGTLSHDIYTVGECINGSLLSYSRKIHQYPFILRYNIYNSIPIHVNIHIYTQKWINNNEFN